MDSVWRLKQLSSPIFLYHFVDLSQKKNNQRIEQIIMQKFYFGKEETQINMCQKVIFNRQRCDKIQIKEII